MTKIRGSLIEANKNEWLHDVGELYVQVKLSTEDENVKKLNEGKSQPVMLGDVVIPSSGKGFPNAVIVDAGSNIQFIMRSKGPRGFGYHVKTAKETIAQLYCCDTKDKPSGESRVRLAYYYKDNKMYNIKVDDWNTMGVAQDKDLREQYWQCRIVTWPVYGFMKDGKSYGTPREGTAEVDVKGGGAHSGDAVDSSVGRVDKIKEPKDPENNNNGYLTMNFFVFKDPEAKKAFYETYKTGSSDDFI
ncbi:hypothetical protein [Halomonas sp.]|uniref:hypothetical protein n=1 Tax=Halomonas sp. TaxID=1486246 RepID=UPI00298D926D|nr:hypothetical protein [Halomonas sp.]MDW7662468.1 hypothetical protein [Bacillota bacterium]MDW7748428.1 hypothetical protein [Halomonas sp.]